MNHPFLLTTQDGLQRAAERIQTLDWAAAEARRLEQQAQVLAGQDLPVFEKDWWDQARHKPWQDIYPEANHHTLFAISEPVNRAADAAVHYALTGNGAAAEAVRCVLDHYSTYEFFVVHPDAGLNWSVWGLQALYAYDLIHHTVSAQTRRKVDDFFHRLCAAVMHDDQWWLREGMGGPYNNHYAWHKLTIALHGLFYGIPNEVDYALYSDMGIRDLIERGARDDGLWLENSLNYQFTAVIPMIALAEAMSNAGHPIDLWTHTFANGRSLRDLLTGPIETLFPDRSLPPVGDTYGSRAILSDVALYYQAYSRYRMPEMAWLLSHHSTPPLRALFVRRLPPETATPPEMHTRLWPELGYAALRTHEGQQYWDGEGMSVFLSCNSDGIHGQADKLSFVAFGNGRHLAADCEARATARHAFSAEVQRQLNRSTIAHNTVMIDGRDHGPVGRHFPIVNWINRPGLKMVTVEDSAGVIYPGVHMMRTVAATDSYILDIFQVASDTEHQIDYLFHADSWWPFWDTSGFREQVPPDENPLRWLRSFHRRTTEGPWSVQSGRDSRLLRLTVAPWESAPTELTLCEFPSIDDYSRPGYPMLIARRQAASTVWATVLQTGEDLPPAEIILAPDRHKALRVRLSGGVDGEFLVPAVQQPQKAV